MDFELIDKITDHAGGILEANRLTDAYKYFDKYLKSKNEKYKEKAIKKLEKVDPSAVEGIINSYMSWPLYRVEKMDEPLDVDEYKSLKRDLGMAKTFLGLYGLMAEAQPIAKKVIQKKMNEYKERIHRVEEDLEKKI